MNKFDYILYFEFKLLFIGFGCVIFFEKKENKKIKEVIQIWQQSTIDKPNKRLLIIVLLVTFY